MPELPEVETVRLGLAPVLEGRRLDVTVRRGDLRRPLPRGFKARLQGRRVMAIERRGKYLLFRLEGDLVWLAHLGMSGRFRIGGSEPATAHDHLLVVTDRGDRIVYHDPRRFGLMDLFPASEIANHPSLSRLGPDPLGEAFTAAYLHERLRPRAAPVKAVLMDQAVVAGMGNIYASESLFRAGIAPLRPASGLGERRIVRLQAAIRSVFAEAIAVGGSSLRDHRQPSGELGYFQARFAVYDRAGLACPGCTCDLARSGGIERLVIGGRSTYWCRRRQR
jgi:formamidopyrimidine-DNA glycosylase